MSIKEIKYGQLTWVNISSINEESINFLKKNYKFHHLDLDDIKSESQIPKLDVYKNYVFLILHFLNWRHHGKKISPHEVDFFIGENYLVTIQHGKNKEIKNFFYRCMNNKKTKENWMSKNSGYLLYKLLESLFSQSRQILNNLGKQISSVENEIFSGEQDLRIIQELAIHRRNVLNSLRIIDPQRYIIATLSHIRKDFLDESLSLYFDDIKDNLDKTWVIVDTFKETIDGLHLTVESIINQKTNRVIGALTVISVALLPLTLLSGIYGMNIDGLPHADNPKMVWFFFFLLATFIISLILILKRRKWF
ncbi:MAG: magnesium transporter CorA family protein [Patescibacteria group bacterium]